MNLGVFGGTFNPPHSAHVRIAEKAERQFHLDKVLFIPAKIPPHKPPTDLADPSHRLAMLRLLLANHSHWATDDLEFRREGPSYTVDTLAELRQRLTADAKLFLILGSDNLLGLPQWRRPREICRMATLLAYERAGYPIPEDVPARLGLDCDCRVIQGEKLEEASTEIREFVRRKKDLSGLVPPGVLAYMQEHKLYRQ